MKTSRDAGAPRDTAQRLAMWRDISRYPRVPVAIGVAVRLGQIADVSRSVRGGVKAPSAQICERAGWGKLNKKMPAPRPKTVEGEQKKRQQRGEGGNLATRSRNRKTAE